MALHSEMTSEVAEVALVDGPSASTADIHIENMSKYNEDNELDSIAHQDSLNQITNLDASSATTVPDTLNSISEELGNLGLHTSTQEQPMQTTRQTKGRKLRKNKMTRVDARFLGFYVTASEDRINVGDIDTV